jgi:hypothetical protein
MTGVGDFDGYTVSIDPTYQAVLGWSVHSCDKCQLYGIPFGKGLVFVHDLIAWDCVMMTVHAPGQRRSFNGLVEC